MFTAKYRSYQPSATQPQDGPTNYDEVELLSGPYEHISKEMEGGYVVIHAHRAGGDLGCTFGPIKGTDAAAGEQQPPRPRLWVMNESGATVATYDL